MTFSRRSIRPVLAALMPRLLKVPTNDILSATILLPIEMVTKITIRNVMANSRYRKALSSFTICISCSEATIEITVASG